MAKPTYFTNMTNTTADQPHDKTHAPHFSTISLKVQKTKPHKARGKSPLVKNYKTRKISSMKEDPNRCEAKAWISIWRSKSVLPIFPQPIHVRFTKDPVLDFRFNSPRSSKAQHFQASTQICSPHFSSVNSHEDSRYDAIGAPTAEVI
jgi:hypothetical protein